MNVRLIPSINPTAAASATKHPVNINACAAVSSGIDIRNAVAAATVAVGSNNPRNTHGIHEVFR